MQAFAPYIARLPLSLLARALRAGRCIGTTGLTPCFSQHLTIQRGTASLPAGCAKRRTTHGRARVGLVWLSVGRLLCFRPSLLLVLQPSSFSPLAGAAPCIWPGCTVAFAPCAWTASKGFYDPEHRLSAVSSDGSANGLEPGSDFGPELNQPWIVPCSVA